MLESIAVVAVYFLGECVDSEPARPYFEIRPTAKAIRWCVPQGHAIALDMWAVVPSGEAKRIAELEAGENVVEVIAAPGTIYRTYLADPANGIESEVSLDAVQVVAGSCVGALEFLDFRDAYLAGFVDDRDFRRFARKWFGRCGV